MTATRVFLLLAASLAPLLVPPVGAQDLAHVGVGTIGYDWSIPGASGRCGFENVHLGLERVNSRLAVTLHSGTRRALSAGIPDAACPLVFAAEPGLWVNPCQVLKGEVPSPATNVGDPYFHSFLGDWWRKTITFSDGGSVTYTLWAEQDWWESGYIYGSCVSGSASASWVGSYGHQDVSTDPKDMAMPHWALACRLAYDFSGHRVECPPLP